jgi:hypothetical protein
MIVDDLDIVRIVTDPPETDAPLVIDPDAHLARSATLQYLEPIARRIAQVFQSQRGIQLPQFPQSTLLHVTRKPSAHLSVPNALGLFGSERSDHRGVHILFRYMIRIKYFQVAKIILARLRRDSAMRSWLPLTLCATHATVVARTHAWQR